MCKDSFKNCCWDNDTTDENVRCYYGIVSSKFDTKVPGYKKIDDGVNNATLHINTVPDFIQNYTDTMNTPDNETLPKVVEQLFVSVEHYNQDYFSVKIRPKNGNSM